MLKNKTIFIIPIVLISLLVVFYLYRISKSDDVSYDETAMYKITEDKIEQDNLGGKQNNKSSKGNCLSDECLAINNIEYPVSDLSEEVIESLNKAIDDEYKAFSTYEAVISKFGNIRPFIMIIRAEEQHISSLKAIFDKYGVTIPENPYANLAIPETISMACSVGVQAEIDNAALYKNELLPSVESYEDITRVFVNLMNASQEKHLPAFEKCAN